MREETHIVKIYSFEELTDEAKQAAVEKLYDLNTGYDWFDCIFEDTKEVGKFLGFEIDDIYFRGFCSQGDGACFDGTWRSENVDPDGLTAYAPKDETLKNICAILKRVTAACGSGYVTVKHQGHYCHEYQTIFPDVEFCRSQKEIEQDEEGDEVSQVEHVLLKALTIDASRSFMRWIYCRLEDEYNYATSDAAIIESIKGNEYEFTERGKLYP